MVFYKAGKSHIVYYDKLTIEECIATTAKYESHGWYADSRRLHD